MKKLSYYYLEFIKVLVVVVLLFAIFGTVNDTIINLISGYSFPDTTFIQGKQYLLGFFILQYIGFFLIVLVLYKNYIQYIGFNKNKNRKSFSALWTKTLTVIALVFIFIFYVLLAIL